MDELWVKLAALWAGFGQKLSDPWVLVGFLGQGLFCGRFLLQWIVSERRGESVIPVGFWYLSIVGALISLVYAIGNADPVFTAAMLFNNIIYVRNLMLIYRQRKFLAARQAAAEPGAGDEL